MDTEQLKELIESGDSAWKVLTIFLLGIYLLLWKYGGELVKLARENNATSKQSHRVAEEARKTAVEVRQEARQISKNIVTNHGSKNLGDAIDRITEWMLVHMQEQRESDRLQGELRRELALHLAEVGLDRDRITEMFAELDDRLNKIENDRERH
jgi:hypothetical protein